MRATLAAVALSAVAVAIPISAAQAHTAITVGIDTPGFGLRFGAPYLPAAPVYLPVPVFVAAPVYAQAPAVVYPPPRLVVQPRLIHPVVYPYRPLVVKRHRHAHRDTHRVFVQRGYAYDRD